MKGLTYSGKKLQFYLILVGFSLLVVIFFGEVLVRVFLPFYDFDRVRRASIQYMPSLFSRDLMKPMQIIEMNNQEENRWFHINNIGYRGPTFTVRKPKGVIRIVTIGGSSVFDQNIKDSSTYDGRDWPH